LLPFEQPTFVDEIARAGILPDFANRQIDGTYSRQSLQRICTGVLGTRALPGIGTCIMGFATLKLTLR